MRLESPFQMQSPQPPCELQIRTWWPREIVMMPGLSQPHSLPTRLQHHEKTHIQACGQPVLCPNSVRPPANSCPLAIPWPGNMVHSGRTDLHTPSSWRMFYKVGCGLILHKCCPGPAFLLLGFKDSHTGHYHSSHWRYSPWPQTGYWRKDSVKYKSVLFWTLWCVLHTIEFEMRLNKGKCLDASVASESSLEEAGPEPGLRWSGATPIRYICTRLQEGPFASCHCWTHHVLHWTFTFLLILFLCGPQNEDKLLKDHLSHDLPSLRLLKWSLKCSDWLFHLQGPRKFQKVSEAKGFVWIRLLWVMSTQHRHCPPGLPRMAQLWQESSQTWDIFVFSICKYHSGI